MTPTQTAAQKALEDLPANWPAHSETIIAALYHFAAPPVPCPRTEDERLCHICDAQIGPNTTVCHICGCALKEDDMQDLEKMRKPEYFSNDFGGGEVSGWNAAIDAIIEARRKP